MKPNSLTNGLAYMAFTFISSVSRLSNSRSGATGDTFLHVSCQHAGNGFAATPHETADPASLRNFHHLLVAPS